MLIEAQLKSMWSWRNKLQIMNLRGGLTKTKTQVDTIQYYLQPSFDTTTEEESISAS